MKTIIAVIATALCAEALVVLWAVFICRVIPDRLSLWPLIIIHPFAMVMFGAWFRLNAKSGFFAGVFFGLFLALPGTAIAHDIANRYWQGKQFARIEPYVRQFVKNDYPEANPQSVYLREKVIVLDASRERCDDILNKKLPRSLVASEPSEVGTILLVEIEYKKVATYSGGLGAYQPTLHLTIVDYRERTRIAKLDFIGGKPPFSIRSGSNANSGKVPYDEVVRYITNLPRK